MLLLREGARDWRTGESANLQSYHEESVDIHHVFPRKWCRENGIDDAISNSIINKTPLTARTNRIIGGAAPSMYLSALESRAGASTDTLDGWLATHLIASHTMRQGDFQSFWDARKSLLLERIAAVMGKPLVSDQQDLLAEDDIDEEEAA